jgi:hypothetical protein
MSVKPTRALLLLILPCVLSFYPPANAQKKSGDHASPAQGIESGKFRIFELKQIQGEETYEIRNEPGGLVVKAKMDLPFWGEELKPLLNATLRLKNDLTPEQFEIKGIRPLEVPIDTSITVHGRAVATGS